MAEFYESETGTCKPCEVGCLKCTKDSCTECDAANGFTKGADN